MKILHIINDMAPAGAQKVVLDLAIGAKMEEHNVEIMTLTTIPSHFIEELYKWEIPLTTINKRRSVYSPLHIYFIGKKMKDFDIVHVHLFPSQYWTSLAKFIFRNLPPIITTEHNTTNKRRNKLFWRLIDSIIYSKYNYIIPCSVEAGESFKKHFPNKPIKVISNGVNLSIIKQANSSLKKNLFNLDESCICIGMVARLQFPKRQDLLIKTIAKLPKRYHAIIVGDGIQKKELITLATELNVADRCHFLGIRSDIPTILKTCDINCLISEHEGLSISSIECMASGKPFIASDVAGLHDIVYGAGILVKNDISDISHAISSLEDCKLYDNVTDKCLHRSEKYNINKVIRDYITIYKECIH